jgi:hypothetical protein
MAYRFFKACSKFFNLKQFGDGESKIQARVVNARIKYFAKKSPRAVLRATTTRFPLFLQ